MRRRCALFRVHPRTWLTRIEATCGCWRRVQCPAYVACIPFSDDGRSGGTIHISAFEHQAVATVDTVRLERDGKWITAEQATSPAYYAAHLRRPVQFEAAIRTLAEDHGLFFLEVGPGNALSTLARANLGGERAKHVTASLSHPRRADRDLKAMLEAVGRLWLSGVPVSWPALANGSLPRRIPLPTYPFERQRYVVGA